MMPIGLPEWENIIRPTVDGALLRKMALVFSKRQACIQSEVGILNAAVCLWERYIAPPMGYGSWAKPRPNIWNGYGLTEI